MKLPFFIEFLRNEGVYFARGDQFTDPFEGSYPRKISTTEKWQGESSLAKSVKASLHERRKNAVKGVQISCWHRSEFESEAMWSLYSDKNFGLAIVSRYSTFRDLLPAEATIAEVKYLDYEKDTFNDYWAIQCMLHKRRSFAHENEIRALMLPDIVDSSIGGTFNCKQKGKGIYVKLPLETLIDKVVISPLAQDWYFEMVDEIMYRFELHVPLCRSELVLQPHF